MILKQFNKVRIFGNNVDRTDLGEIKTQNGRSAKIEGDSELSGHWNVL